VKQKQTEEVGHLKNQTKNDMKHINEYLSNQIKSKYYGDACEWASWIDDEFPDDLKPRFRKGDETQPYLWWRAYKYLLQNGPASKAEILRSFGLKETSYATEFAKLSAQNIIVPNTKTKKLEPQRCTEWKLKSTTVHTGYSTHTTWEK